MMSARSKIANARSAIPHLRHEPTDRVQFNSSTSADGRGPNFRGKGNQPPFRMTQSDHVRGIDFQCINEPLAGQEQANDAQHRSRLCLMFRVYLKECAHSHCRSCHFSYTAPRVQAFISIRFVGLREPMLCFLSSHVESDRVYSESAPLSSHVVTATLV